MSESERLLAAELEVARLREGLEESRGTAHADIAKARETAKDGCGLCRELALHLARCHSVLTVDSPPDLGPLRELVRVAEELLMIDPEVDWVDHTEEHEGAYRAVLARYPLLGERP